MLMLNAKDEAYSDRFVKIYIIILRKKDKCL